MSRNIIFVLMYHRHKLLDFTLLFVLRFQVADVKELQLLRLQDSIN
jgi:hypothetical protein